MDNYGLLFLGMVLGFVVKPFLESASKGLGEKFSDWSMGRVAEREKSLGRQPIDQENATHRASLEVANQLRTAAIERRLEAHQEAFFLWRKLLRVYNSVDVTSSVIEVQEWWEKNCLYLEPDAREALSEACALAAMAPQRMRGGPLEHETASQFKEDFRKFHEAGNRILNAVALPPLAEIEKTPKITL